LHQFVLHSSLDAVDDMIWATQAMFLNVVDKFNALQVRLVVINHDMAPTSALQQQVSAFVTAAHIKFLLLHDGRSEESVKNFFKDVYEAYLRVRDSGKPFTTPFTTPFIH
jgi:hypothetical protein